ncbi:MAG: GNAT family N-acetyltransferase [Deltaproteobacteria bacterium]|nr:GNAT family N-acetyltransferase [Deltaproteobacteria bacterium]
MDSRTAKWRDAYRKRLTDANHALEQIPSGSRIFLGTGAGEPTLLVEKLATSPSDLADLEAIQVWPMRSVSILRNVPDERIRLTTLYPGPSAIDAIERGQVDYTPVFLSRLPALFRSHRIHIDAAIIQVSPPDEHGYVSLGVSVDVTKAAAQSADLVIAQVNPRMPRTHGDSFLHITDIDWFVRHSHALPQIPSEQGSEVHDRIGMFVAQLVSDGATLHVGLGHVPKAASKHLQDRRDLGVHTEFFGDWLLDLVEAGLITNSRKTLHRGKTVASYCLGSDRLYDFVNDNPAFEMYQASHVNSPHMIAKNDLVVSLTTAHQVDLTGQVGSPLGGKNPYASPEGQTDFLRGAALSRGGRPIVALASTDEAGRSRIVGRLDENVVVTATRADVHYVVTEYGIAALEGKTIRERTLALIDIAHPDVRNELLDQAKHKKFVYQDQLPPPVGPRDTRGFTAHHQLRDGTSATIRPVTATDERMLQELFHGLTETDRYYRFFSSISALPHRAAQKLCRTNYRDEMAVIATIPRGEGELVAGSGQYILNRRLNLAEFAVMVHKDHRNKGIGTGIVRHLIRIARQQDIRGLRAQVLPQNKPMLHIVKKYGFPVQSEIKDAALELTLLFQDLPAHLINDADSD